MIDSHKVVWEPVEQYANSNPGNIVACVSNTVRSLHALGRIRPARLCYVLKRSFLKAPPVDRLAAYEVFFLHNRFQTSCQPGKRSKRYLLLNRKSDIFFYWKLRSKCVCFLLLIESIRRKSLLRKALALLVAAYGTATVVILMILAMNRVNYEVDDPDQ